MQQHGCLAAARAVASLHDNLMVLSVVWHAVGVLVVESRYLNLSICGVGIAQSERTSLLDWVRYGRWIVHVVYATIMFCSVSTKASTSVLGVVSWEIMIFLRRIPLCYIINLPCECLEVMGDKVILLLLWCRLKKYKKYKTLLYKIHIRVYCLHCLMLRVCIRRLVADTGCCVTRCRCARLPDPSGYFVTAACSCAADSYFIRGRSSVSSGRSAADVAAADSDSS